MKRCKNLLEAMGKCGNQTARQRLLRSAMTMSCHDFVESYGTSDFTNLLIDASHVRAQKAYDEVPTIWQDLVSIDNTVVDFKPHHIQGMGAFGDLPEVKEEAPYPEVTFSDKGASLTVAKHGAIFGVSMEAQVNDQLGKLGSFAAGFNASAARTLDKDCIQNMIQANPTVQEDAVALFAAGHSNDEGTASGYSRANLVNALDLFANQTGLDGEQVYVQPRYLLVRSNKWLEAQEDATSADKLVVDFATSAGQVQGKRNALRDLNLQVITSPYLSTDAFYLLADPKAYAGLVYGFLRGRQTPELLSENKDSGMSFATDTSRFKTRHIWGRTWADYRAAVRGGV